MTIEELNRQAKRIREMGRELQSSLDVMEKAREVQLEKGVKTVCVMFAHKKSHAA